MIDRLELDKLKELAQVDGAISPATTRRLIAEVLRLARVSRGVFAFRPLHQLNLPSFPRHAASLSIYRRFARIST